MTLQGAQNASQTFSIVSVSGSLSHPNCMVLSGLPTFTRATAPPLPNLKSLVTPLLITVYRSVFSHSGPPAGRTSFFPTNYNTRHARGQFLPRVKI